MSLWFPVVPIVPYCPYGSLLSLWFPIVPMVPYCPYGSLLSLWFPIVLMVPYCPHGSLRSWIHFVLVPFCPGSILSWIHFVLDPFCPVLLGPRSALTRKYRGRPWAMEWHWQRTTFPANRTKIGKKIGPKITKKIKIEDFGSRLVQIDFRLGRSP